MPSYFTSAAFTKQACPVPEIANADVFGNMYTVGSRIKAECHAGYRMTTDLQPIRCGTHGQWTNLPNCDASCPDPSPVPNADISPGNNTFGEVRNYTCRPDTVLLSLDDVDDSVTTTKCLHNSTWTTIHFVCLKDCDEPASLSNAVIGPGYNTGKAERYYKCKEGYRTPLNTTYAIITCQINRTWTVPSTYCIKHIETRLEMEPFALYIVASLAGQHNAMPFTFGFFTNADSENLSWKVYIASSYPTKVNITAPLRQFAKEIEVSTGTEVTLPEGLHTSSNTGHGSCAIRVESDTPVSVYVESVVVSSTDGSVVIPDTRLSTEYALLSWSDHPVNKAGFTVIGTVDSTKVVITLMNSSQYLVNLNKNQVYHSQTPEEISGTSIRATERVAVFAGHQCTNIITEKCDYLYEQMPPISDLQTEYIVSFPYPRYKYVLRVMAVKDNTEVSLSNGTSIILKRTEYAQYRFHYSPIVITATEKVMVAVYSLGRKSRPKGYPATFDGAMLIMPGISQFKPEYDIFVPADLERCVLMVTFPSYASSIYNIRLNHQQFMADKSAEVSMIGRGLFTVLYTSISAGTSVIYSTDGTPFGAYLSFFRVGSESWFSLTNTF